MVNRDGRGSRTEPIVVEPPVLVPVMSADDRARTVALLTEILAGWWVRHYGDKRITDVWPQPWRFPQIRYVPR